ncbi:sushi, nidogen and EGF-like domain-containing protein 1 [Stylophora pistillata]|uniref:sushi, nidogen and EGF-like domain-containing protein 1 n=1 Tax=Stylophora pistillata TaxID=50429 RepID=UPI000C05064D|nr:sushi, nidogen and EGF-like domain-containing protein 1 [Stylophora pistillata]
MPPQSSLGSSVNLATSERADGTFWCEFLSSDGYRNPKGYRRNQSSHHFNLDSPCSSYPCHNGGACEANHRDNTFECICESGFTGEYCEKALKACKDIYDVHKQVALNVSKLVPLIISEKPVSILCQMGDFGCGDGGWTPVMKIDGSKV